MEPELTFHVASERLNEAENGAYNDHRKAQHSSHAVNAYKSSIYAPGTEYILCQSMAQLMAALVGVLNESLTESIKAFYKLRKAYIALDGVMQMEEKFLQSQNARNISSSRASSEKGSKHSGASSKSMYYCRYRERTPFSLISHNSWLRTWDFERNL